MVAGGFDAANVPEINYGLLSSAIGKHFALFSFHNCDKILAVSNFTREELIKNVGALHDKIEVIHNGFSEESFEFGTNKKKIIMTVCSIKRSTFELKGINTMVKVAESMPNYCFYVVGNIDSDFLTSIGIDRIKNITFLGWKSSTELNEIYKEAQVYLQLSFYESFGCALAESMLCGCIPVVTNRAALPEVVGDCGYYVPYGDVEKTREAIQTALVNAGLRAAVRERIKKCFPLSSRKDGLMRVINSLLEENGP